MRRALCVIDARHLACCPVGELRYTLSCALRLMQHRCSQSRILPCSTIALHFELCVVLNASCLMRHRCSSSRILPRRRAALHFESCVVLTASCLMRHRCSSSRMLPRRRAALHFELCVAFDAYRESQRSSVFGAVGGAGSDLETGCSRG
jgi:hypothetical protein